MSTAEVISFPTQQEPSKEIRVADCDNGYTRLANDLYDALIAADLTRNQAKVAHAICRKTYGFNKKTDRISDSQLAELTKLPRQKVNKAKNELIDMKVICRIGHEIGPNKNIFEWNFCHQNSDKKTTKNDCHQNGDIVTKTVTTCVTKTVTGVSPKQGHTKDTYTKYNIKDNKILKDNTHTDEKSAAKKTPRSTAKQTITDLDFSSWPAMPSEQVMADWLAHRKSKKATITQTVINNFGAQFQIAAKHGLSVDDCLAECMTRNWQGFKAEWLIKNNNQSPIRNQSGTPRQDGFKHTGEPSFFAGKI